MGLLPRLYVSGETHWYLGKRYLLKVQQNKQWGGCSPGGRLSLNPLLVKAPQQCIDYVMIHELCHLKHHNHSDAFYRLLTRHCPNWERIKQRPDNLAELILA